MPSLNTGNAILSNPIKVDSSYNVGIGGAASGSFKLQVTGTTNLTGALTGTSATFSGSVTSNANEGFIIAPSSGASYINYKIGATSYSLIGIAGANNDIISGSATGDLNIRATNSQKILFSNNNGASASLTIASTGAATFSAASGGAITLTTNGSANNWTSAITGNSTTSQSYGLLIQAGTNSTDAALRVRNQANSLDWLFVRGDGNVGIGRTDPSFILDVNDTNASGARGLRISTSSTAAGPALYLYINSGAQTNWAIGNSYAVGNTLEFISSNSVGGNPGSAGTSRMLITPTGDVTINTARTSGANVNAITIADNVTGVQTSGFGVRILATSNNGQAKSAIGFEADGGTNNDTAIAFYTQTNAASLDRRMTINRNGNVLINTTTDNGDKLNISGATSISGNLGVGRGSESGVRLSVTGATNGSDSYATIMRQTSGQDLFIVRSDGNINTGTRAASPYNAGTTGRTMVIESTGGLGYNTSTRESKINIEKLNDVSWLYKLNPVSFNYRKKDDEMNYTDEAQDEKWYGLIADEVESINDDLVFYNTKEDGSKQLAGVEYNKIIAALIKSSQQQQAQIEAQQQQINSLINR